MTEEKKDIEREKDNCLDSDEDTSKTSEAGNVAGTSSSNRVTSSLEVDSKRNYIEYVANGPEQNSNEEPKIIYEYPSDPDEERCNQCPQAYFDNTDLCHETSNFNISSLSQSSVTMTKESENEIHEVPKEKESPDLPSNKLEVQNPCTQIYEVEIKEENAAFQDDHKAFGLKYMEYSSDEFADVEDNIRDSLSDNSESYCGLHTVSPLKYSNDFLPSKGTAQGQENETREEDRLHNKCKMASYSSSSTEIIKQAKEETSKVRKFHGARSRQAEASCSYPLPSCSKQPDTFSILIAPKESEEKYKCSLPTIGEESELEKRSNILKDNKPSRSKTNPLKMKAKVGIRKDKCNVCRVRLGLCAIKCRCGGYYCAKHRYDKEHDCPFDYRTMGAEEIRKNNPRIIAEKVRKL